MRFSPDATHSHTPKTSCGYSGHCPSLQGQKEVFHCKHHCTQLPFPLARSAPTKLRSLSQSHIIPPICSQSSLAKHRPLTTDGRCSCRKQNPQRQTSSPSPSISGRASPLACPLGETQAEKGIRKDMVHSPAFSPRLVMGWRELGTTTRPS